MENKFENVEFKNTCQCSYTVKIKIFEFKSENVELSIRLYIKNLFKMSNTITVSHLYKLHLQIIILHIYKTLL